MGRCVGIYGVAPTCHLSALARMDDYRLTYLDRGLEEDRSLVRVRAMRGSVHILPYKVLEVALAATRRQQCPTQPIRDFRNVRVGVWTYSRLPKSRNSRPSFPGRGPHPHRHLARETERGFPASVGEFAFRGYEPRR